MWLSLNTNKCQKTRTLANEQREETGRNTVLNGTHTYTTYFTHRAICTYTSSTIATLQHYRTECTESLHSRLHTDSYFFHPPASEQYSRLSVNYSTWSQTSYKRAHIDHRTHVNDASFMQPILTATLNSPCTTLRSECPVASTLCPNCKYH